MVYLTEKVNTFSCVKCHFLTVNIRTGKINVSYISTSQNIANTQNSSKLSLMEK